MAEAIPGAALVRCRAHGVGMDDVTSASDSLSDQLRWAIENKHLIELRYHGSARVAEPHDYGVYKGIERLLIFQLRDSDHSHHSATGWRLLNTAQIEECLVLKKHFPGSRGHVYQSHLVWDQVYARVR